MSLQSTSEITSDEQEQDQLEDLIYEMMGRTGLLSELKSKIAQFVQANGRTKENNSVNFSRANPNILSLIYEYLKWIGMKNTCTLLLSESPVPISKVQTSTKADESLNGSPPVPQLCTYLSEVLNKTESQSSFIFNETFTKSLEPHSNQPMTSTPNNNGIGISNNNKTKQQEESQINSSMSGGKESNNVNGAYTTSNLNQTYVSKPSTNLESVHKTNATTNVETKSNSNNSSSHSSSAEESNVKYDDDKSEGVDSFSFNNSKKLDKDTNRKQNPVVLTVSNSDQASSLNSMNKESSQKVDLTGKGDGVGESFGGKDVKKEEHSSRAPLFKVTSKDTENLLDISNPLAHKSDISEPDFDESISDLLDGKSEDETLDVSIDSDGKGMSSCEHYINLK